MGPLGQYLPNWLPDDPNKNAAARQGLLSFGASMLGGRGDFGGILGDGLMAGSQGYNGALAQQQQAALHKAQQQHWDLENKETQAKLDEPMQLQKILSGGQPAPMGPPANLPRIGAAPPAGAAPSATVAPESGPAPAPMAAGPVDLFQTYMSYGDRLTHAGRPTQAKAYYDLAEKMRPEVRDVSEMTVDGNRVMVQLFKDGRPPQVLDGYSPKAEKLSFHNTGGSTVALDSFTGKPVNTIANSVSPGEKLAADTARQAREAADRRAREALNQGKTPAGYRWAADGKTLEPIPGGPVAAKTTEVQTKIGDAKSVLDLLNIAEPLISTATSSYGGVALDQVARVVGHSTDGSEATAQLQALEGSLVSKMPKMSGPQSDKDVLLYKQMAGRIGDPTIPVANKQAAVEVIRQISEKYLKGVGVEPPPRVKPVKDLPKKAAPNAYPSDIGNLINKYGAK